MQLSVARAAGRRQRSVSWDELTSCAELLASGSRSGHFFDRGIISHTSDELEGLGDKLLTVVRHCELIEGLDLKRGDFSGK